MGHAVGGIQAQSLPLFIIVVIIIMQGQDADKDEARTRMKQEQETKTFLLLLLYLYTGKGKKYKRGKNLIQMKAQDKRRGNYYNYCLLIVTEIAVETTGVFGPEARVFLRGLGKRLQYAMSEPEAFSYLLQRISIAVQRANCAAILGSLNKNNEDLNCILF